MKVLVELTINPLGLSVKNVRNVIEHGLTEYVASDGFALLVEGAKVTSVTTEQRDEPELWDTVGY